MKKINLFLLTLSIASALFVSSCDDGEKTEEQVDSTLLYYRLGGEPAIKLVVDQFITNVAADTVINSFFAETDIPRLKTLLVEQICQGSGGPCTYSGRSMLEAHEGLGISTNEFNALVGDLQDALEQYNVPQKEEDDLLAILGPMAPDIIEE